MKRILSAAAVAAAFQARYPGAALPAVVAEVSASEGTLDGVQAAGVRGYTAPSSKLAWVKAISHFFVGGEIVEAEDFVEIEEGEAKRLVRNGQAEHASKQDVDAAVADGAVSKGK